MNDLPKDHIPWTRLAFNNPPRLANAERDKQASKQMTRVLKNRVIKSVAIKDASEEGGVIFGSVLITFVGGVSLKFSVSGIDAVMDCTVENP